MESFLDLDVTEYVDYTSVGHDANFFATDGTEVVLIMTFGAASDGTVSMICNSRSVTNDGCLGGMPYMKSGNGLVSTR